MIFNLFPIGMTLLCINAVKISKRMKNGKVVENGEYPYVGWLNATWGSYRHSCTAILLDHETIVSAAHCFCIMGVFPINNSSSFTVTFGSVKPNEEDPSKQTSTVRKLYIHDSFYAAYSTANCSDLYSYKDPNPLYDNQIDAYTVYDVCIAKLSNPLNYTQNVQPIQLSNIDYRPPFCMHFLGFSDGVLKRGAARMCWFLEDYYYTSCGKCWVVDKDQINMPKELEALPYSGDSGGPVIASENSTLQGRVVAIVTNFITSRWTGSVTNGVYLSSFPIYDWVYNNTDFSVLRE